MLLLRIVCICTFICLGLTSAEITLLNSKDELTTNHIIEWRLSKHDQKWIDFDTRNTPIMFIHDPDGKKITRASFVYQDQQHNKADMTGSGLLPVGKPELRIRHQCRKAGKHSWHLIGPQGEKIANGTLAITKGEDPVGPLTLSKNNYRLLAFRNNKTFIPIGCNIAWANAPKRLELMQSYMRKLAANGGTHFRMWMCSWSGQVESGKSGDYRLDHAYIVDQVLKTARSLGLYVTVVLDNHHDLVHGLAFPYGDDASKRIAKFLGTPLNEAYKQRIQYIFARYACDDHILAWELFNELDEALYNQTLPAHMPDMRDICARWVPTAAQFLQSINQDDHLITSSLSWQTWPEVVAAKGLDIVQVHQYIPNFDKVHPLHHDGLLPLQAHLPRLNDLKKPFRFSEVGHNGTNEYNPANKKDPAGLLLRQQAWAGFLYGGYGTGMSWWWDIYIDTNDLWQVYQPIAKITALIDWQDAHLEPFPPNTGGSLRVIGWQSHTQCLLWPQIRANTWHALTIDGNKPRTYTGQGLVLRGFLPHKTYTVRWFNMLDGKQFSEERAVAGIDGKITLYCPKDQLQMVAVIKKQE